MYNPTKAELIELWFTVKWWTHYIAYEARHEESKICITVYEDWEVTYRINSEEDPYYSAEAYPKSLQDIKDLIRLFTPKK